MSLQAFQFGHTRCAAGASRFAEDCAAYLDLVRRTLVNFAVRDDDFFVDSRVLRLPDVGIISSRASAFGTIRTRAMAEGNDDRALFMCLEGAAGISHLGRETTVAAGEAILLSTADPIRIERSASRHMLIFAPRTVLAPMTVDMDDAMMSPMNGENEPLRLLRRYVDLLTADPAMCRPELHAPIASHVQDLVALAVGASRDAAEAATGRGLRAVRLGSLKADIEQNLASGDVSSEALARRHRISPRYVRKLFEGEGTSLSHFVLGRRLLRVHRMLTDPRYADHTIGSLAFDTGFGDLSTFNHAFRRHFGTKPSDVRAAVREQNSQEKAGRRASPHTRPLQ